MVRRDAASLSDAKPGVSIRVSRLNVDDGQDTSSALIASRSRPPNSTVNDPPSRRNITGSNPPPCSCAWTS